MTRILGAFAILLLIGTVVLRVAMLRRRGVAAMKFGTIDKTDFLIPPFALFYVYLVLAGGFGLPTIIHAPVFSSSAASGLGVTLCAAGLVLMLWSIASFGTSFRVGIDTEGPGNLVTSGAFAHTRNPIYVAFAFVLVGEFFIFPNWLFLAYVFAGFMLFHRQVLREETYLASRYGPAYEDYSRRVPRYL